MLAVYEISRLKCSGRALSLKSWWIEAFCASKPWRSCNAQGLKVCCIMYDFFFRFLL